MRGDDVRPLQRFLISQNHLAASNDTGYFGPLTETAVKKYQCAKSIICTGSPSTTGYGAVGPKTQAAVRTVCSRTAVVPAQPPSPLPYIPSPPINYQVCGTTNVSAANHETGYNYIAPFITGGDQNDAPSQSHVLIFENGTVLAPAHSQHADIRAFGGGRFSHWYGYLYFSASDNSNPATNGKSYTYGVLQGKPCPPRAIEIRRVAGNASGYATFQSNNQLVVANGNGIFISYLSDVKPGLPSVDDIYDWQIQRSTDGGATFTPIYSGEGYTRAPTIETDEDGNIYAFVSDYSPEGTNATSGDVIFYKFLASNNYQNPATEILPGEAVAAKYTAIYDRKRRQFYYFPMLEGPFATVDKNGGVIRTLKLFSGGSSVVQYPHLAMDGARLYAAWTTTPLANGPIGYDGIHFIYSDDGGVTWYAPGVSAPLTLPIVPDDTGPTPEIVPPQYVKKVNTWLSNFAVVNGIAHFMYTTADYHEMYQRFSVAPFSKLSELDGTWGAQGNSIYGLDAFFTQDGTTLYAIGGDGAEQTALGTRPIVVMKSTDNGASWSQYAKSGKLIYPYSLGGARYVRGFGITGIVTDLVNPGATIGQDVDFIHVPTE